VKTEGNEEFFREKQGKGRSQNSCKKKGSNTTGQASGSKGSFESIKKRHEHGGDKGVSGSGDLNGRAATG